jgi:hypothetical protein
MPYSIAGIDVHKKMLVVVVAEVTEQGEWSYERGKFGATAYELQRLADWFQQQGVQEVVMESTAQYWRPVWGALEFLMWSAFIGTSPRSPKERIPLAMRQVRSILRAHRSQYCLTRGSWSLRNASRPGGAQSVGSYLRGHAGDVGLDRAVPARTTRRACGVPPPGGCL